MRGHDSNGGGRDRLRVLLAIGDFPMLEAGFRATIDTEPDMVVVGQIHEHPALRETLERTPAEVVIAECAPYGAAACATAETIETIRGVRPGARVIALECRCSSEQFSLALKAGADGFLTRDAQPADVVAAVRAVARGQTYVSPAVVTRMVNTYVLRTQAGVEDPYESLTDREREILVLAALGHTNREIAETLRVGEQTVHNDRADLMEKLGFHDRVELLKYAIRRGVLNVEDL